MSAPNDTTLYLSLAQSLMAGFRCSCTNQFQARNTIITIIMIPNNIGSQPSSLAMQPSMIEEQADENVFVSHMYLKGMITGALERVTGFLPSCTETKTSRVQ